MSVELMSKAYGKKLTAGQQRVLLVLCDHANDDGLSCHPSIGKIAWKIGISTSTVMRMIKELETLGAIQVRRKHREVNRYRITLDNLEDKPPYQPSDNEMEEWPDLGSQNATQEESLGGKMQPTGWQNATHRVAKCNPQGGKMQQEPSVNHQVNRQGEPSHPATPGSAQTSSNPVKEKRSQTKNSQSARRGDRKQARAFAMADAYMQGKGVSPGDFTPAQKHQAANVFKDLPARFGPPDVEACTRYLMTDPFWREPGKLTFRRVADTIVDWDAQGRPEAMIAAIRATPQRTQTPGQALREIAKQMEREGL